MSYHIQIQRTFARVCRCVVAFFLAQVLIYDAIADDAVTIWIKAFIPREHKGAPNLIKKVPDSDNRWVLEGPPPNYVCFETDNRLFSSDKSASARVTTQFTILISGESIKLEPSNGDSVHLPGVSHKLDCGTGKFISKAPGAFMTQAIGKPHYSDKKAQVIGQVSTKNPFTPAVVAPFIDYSFDFIFDVRKGMLSYSVSLGEFPAFEAYASVNESSPVTIFQQKPRGNSIWKLYDLGTGFNTYQLKGQVKLRDPEPEIPSLSGKWTGNCEWSKGTPYHVKDPVTITLDGRGTKYTGEHTSHINGTASTLSNFKVDFQSKRISFRMFGWDYAGTIDYSGSIMKITVKPSWDNPVCTYTKRK